MSASLRVNTLATRWEVDVSRLPEDVAGRLRTLWAATAAWTPDRSEPPGFPRRLVAHTLDQLPGEGDDECVLLPADADSAPYAFSGMLTLKAISAQAGRLTMLHASALALPESGASVLLVAASGTGKTTAATRLGRDLDYLTDETAAVRDDLSIVPHPKPLSIVGPGGKHERSPAELGLRPHRDDAWVGATLLLDRVAGESARLEPMPILEAVIQAIPQSSSLPSQDAPFARLLAVFGAGRGVHRLVYGEVEEAVPVVLDLLRSARRGERTDLGVELLPPPPDRRGTPWSAHPGAEADLTAGTRVRRAPWVDAVGCEDEVLVLNGPQPVRLLGIGATTWLAASEPTSLADLLAIVVDTHGTHPEADRLVGEAVAALVSQGMLTVEA